MMPIEPPRSRAVMARSDRFGSVLLSTSGLMSPSRAGRAHIALFRKLGALEVIISRRML